MDHERRTAVCTNCGRNRPHHARGWCPACYSRWNANGCPPDGPPAPRRPAYRTPVLGIDEIAVARAVAGWSDTPINAAERREAIAILRRQGVSLPRIAERLGCCVRTVERHRAALNRSLTTTGA